MTQLTPRANILIKENRQRQEFEAQAMEDLRSSIETNGLLHCPVLRVEAGQLVLVAGERRLKALEDLWSLGSQVRYNGEIVPAGMVPYVTLGELSPLEAEEAELDENLKRKDLTWQEHAQAVGRLHSLRKIQKMGGPEDNTISLPQSYADTALEVLGKSEGSAQDSIRKEVLVSKHLDNPEVMRAKSADEAFKILKKQEVRKANEALALSVGATFSSENHRLLNVDCNVELMQPQWQGYFDVICTDPPYGMGAQDFGDGGKNLPTHVYDDSIEAWRLLMGKWCALSYMVTKPQAHAYLFCDFDNFHELKIMMQASGWYVFRTPLILHKVNSGRVPLPDQGPRRQYELILYAIKGRKQVTHIYPDLFSATGDENYSHGAQKPVAAMANLLQRSVRPGDKVLDCFGGTGPTIEAGNSFQCSVTYMELSAHYYGIALKRVAAMRANETPDMLAQLESAK